ncbi:MAG TPA: type II toxin-antitoxin system RelE/ParE family toxin [Patescibacteria group bacterium]|nr:type II toxin-antitoxin system RelE/ParE family toxin [Patescibacteria group bacterium]
MDIVLSKDANKQYNHLPKPEQAKIHKKLIALRQDLYAGKKLTGDLAGIRSLRAWPYRILYEINEKAQRIEVHKIAHRQGVYR